MKPKIFFFTVLIASLVISCNQSRQNNEKKPEAKTEEVQEIQEPKQFTAKGKVINADTGEPISMVAVIIAGTRNATLTSPDGKFVITGPVGAKKLAFSVNGFEGLKVDIDTEKEMIVKLKPKAE